MTLLEQIKQKAQERLKTIVLPEGTDERILKAVETLMKEKIANPILIGKRILSKLKPNKRARISVELRSLIRLKHPIMMIS